MQICIHIHIKRSQYYYLYCTPCKHIFSATRQKLAVTIKLIGDYIGNYILPATLTVNDKNISSKPRVTPRVIATSQRVNNIYLFGLKFSPENKSEYLAPFNESQSYQKLVITLVNMNCRLRENGKAK